MAQERDKCLNQGPRRGRRTVNKLERYCSSRIDALGKWVGSVLVCWGCNKIPQTGQLKQPTFISASSAGWKPETRVSAGLLPPEASSLLDLPVAMSLQCVCLSSYKRTSPRGLGPHPMTSFNLNYLLKGPSPNSHSGN